MDGSVGHKDEAMRWGRQDAGVPQGSAYRHHFDRRYWTAQYSALYNTLERDGPITFDGKAWRSAGGASVSFPRSIQDDFGSLVPVARWTT